MKRTVTHDVDLQNKRPRLENGPCKSSYPADSARLITEWDDDLDVDELEEVCIIAELSQVPRISLKPPAPVESKESQLEAECKRLKESLKTREGEVGILRSQLKQNQIAKQNEALNHMKNVDKLEEKYKANVEAVKKQVEQLQSELEFKDLEVKGLTEKCKQLEIKGPRVNFIPVSTGVEEKRNLFSLSQAISSKTKVVRTVEVFQEKTAIVRRKKETKAKTEGEKLTRILDPSFFRSREEPSVIPMYASNVSYRESLDHAKSDKYKWIGLPTHVPRLHRLEPIMMELCRSEQFSLSLVKTINEMIMDVLGSLLELLNFLNTLPMSVHHDQALLEDMNPGPFWTMADVLSDNLMRPGEKALEARRMLAAVCCVADSSTSALETLASMDFLSCLKKVVSAIGKLLRPVEFTGVCIGILFFLQVFLKNQEKEKIDNRLLELCRSILAEIILSRPKLDVLREVIVTLTAGAHHTELAPALCKKSPADTSALYMDAKLQQALFFTREACPLKLLNIQVKTLAHFCGSQLALRSITLAFINWLHSLQARSLKPQLWFFLDLDKCCNILECFCSLLTLSVSHIEQDADFRKTFEKGIEILRDCSKGHERKLKQSTLKLLPSTLRSPAALELLSPAAREAAFFIINEYDTDTTTQETRLNCALNVTNS